MTVLFLCCAVYHRELQASVGPFQREAVSFTCGVFPVAIEEVFRVRTTVLRCPSREAFGQHVM